MSKDLKTIVILGMHMSATSFIAKGIQACGGGIGSALLPDNDDNQYGYFEDLDFVGMNEQILHCAGGTWDCPPREHRIEEAGVKLKNDISTLVRKKIAQARKERRLFWGWKDPRTCLTIHCYMPFLLNPHFITVFRDPKKVAISLINRNGFKYTKAISLAKEYNKRILEFLDIWNLTAYQ